MVIRLYGQPNELIDKELKKLTITTLRDQVSHQSKSPLYQQLYQLLRNKILAGEWHPDEMLPSEADLIAQYQVSRATVRQALDELVSDGLIYRKQGRGTFVAPPTVEQGLVRIVSFTEDMQQRGFTAGNEADLGRIDPRHRIVGTRTAS